MAVNDLDGLLTTLKMGPWNYVAFGIRTFLEALVPVYLFGSQFMAPTPQFSCNIPDDSYIFPDNSSQCFMVEELHGQSRVVPCESWSYDTSVFTSTMGMEWNLVCDRAMQSSLFQVLYNAGTLFGSIISGIAASRYGCRWTIRTASLLLMAVTVAMLFVPTYSVILAIRFLMGVLMIMMFPCGILISMESCPPQMRATVTILGAVPFPLMVMGLSGIAYMLQDWRLIQVAATWSLLPLIVCIFLVADESPRWLLVKGRVEEAVKVFERAIRINKVDLPRDFNIKEKVLAIYEDIIINNPANVPTPEDTKNADISTSFEVNNHHALGLNDGVGPWWAGPLALFRTSPLRKLMVMSLLARFLQGIVYLGIPLTSGKFSSPYVYMALLGAVEMPAYIFSPPLTDRLGRKRVTIFCQLLCSLCLLSYFGLKEIGFQSEWLHMVIISTGYMVLSTARMVLFTLTCELLPTTLRSWGSSASTLIGFIGCFIAPIIMDFPPSNLDWIMPATLGICAAISGLLVLFLPETKGKNLPETVADLMRLQRKLSTSDERPRMERAAERLDSREAYGDVRDWGQVKVDTDTPLMNVHEREG